MNITAKKFVMILRLHSSFQKNTIVPAVIPIWLLGYLMVINGGVGAAVMNGESYNVYT
jgi:hypothetical protein